MQWNSLGHPAPVPEAGVYFVFIAFGWRFPPRPAAALGSCPKEDTARWWIANRLETAAGQSLSSDLNSEGCSFCNVVQDNKLNDAEQCRKSEGCSATSLIPAPAMQCSTNFTVRSQFGGMPHRVNTNSSMGLPIPSISNIVLALKVLHAQTFKVVGRPDRPPVADGHAKVVTMHASESSSSGRAHSAATLRIRQKGSQPDGCQFPLQVLGWPTLVGHLTPPTDPRESCREVAHSALDVPSAFRGRKRISVALMTPAASLEII